MMRRLLIATGFALLAGGAALSQSPQTPPSCDGLEHRADFDFWVGEWNVYGPDGQFAGTNSIRKSQGGCLIEEHWSGAGGSTGFSMNYYDPLQESWRQVWMSAGAYIDYTGGLNDDGAMVLEGEIFYQQRSDRFPFRGVWTPNDDGSVTQHFTQYDPDADTWNDWFIGRYVRQEDDPNAQSGE
jgi:hypothetical protein